MNAVKSAVSNLYYFIKRRLIKQTLLDLWFVRVKCRRVWLGGEGCGFYVCQDALPARAGGEKGAAGKSRGLISYSAGVGDDVSFDLALYENFATSEIRLFDPTPLTVEWVARQKLPEEFRFHPWGISGETGTVDFYLSDTTEASSAASSSMIADGNKWVSKERKIAVEVKSIADIARENGHTFVDLLKMDIEGSEFDVIESFKRLDGVRFGQICIEFHQRFFPDRWRVLNQAVKTLSDCGYKCFAVNWNMMEFSFLNVRMPDGGK